MTPLNHGEDRPGRCRVGQMPTSTPYQDRARHRHVGGQGRPRRVDRLRSREGSQRERTRWVVSSWIPQGRGLPDEDWNTRHRVLLWVLALHPPVLVAYAYATGSGVVHGLVMIVPVVLLLGGALAAGRRRARACALSLGLLVSSAVLVHLARGAIEAHFH